MENSSLQIHIPQTISSLDVWFDSMRSPEGYGGPVAHWWRDSLAFAGAGLDWRYEGIISGYLNLFRINGDATWLDKACQAGDDLVRGQTDRGNYRNSTFELNPLSRGTPHEAACDLALLRLASMLSDIGQANWRIYAESAVRNLIAFILTVLWDQDHHYFHNTTNDDAFVPNKAATNCEAIFAWAKLTGDEGLITRYCLPTLDRIIAVQVHAPGNSLDGAIPQVVNGSKSNQHYFPFYIARCIPALVLGWQVSGKPCYLGSAKEAIGFIHRWQKSDGSFPQVISRQGRLTNPYPCWIAAVGDILRSMTLLEACGESVRIEPTLGWLLQGVQYNGSIRTAYGFASRFSHRRPSLLPDFRDVLGVCGWADKAFHFLTSRPEASGVFSSKQPLPKLAVPCRFHRTPAILREDDRQIEVRRGQNVLYRWWKGAAWVEGYGL